MLDEAIKFIEDQRVIAVVRASDHGNAEAIARAMIDGGIRIVEVTPNVSQWSKLIESLSKQKDLLVGLGSATDGEMAFRAINAGAKFVSSHYTDKSILTVCKNHEIPVIQGAASVTEMMQATELGVDLLKLYPAEFLGGTAYVQRLKRSFPSLKIVPSGGVNLENLLDYIKAGAVACVVGSALCDKSVIRADQWVEVTDRAKQFTQRIASTKVARQTPER